MFNFKESWNLISKYLLAVPSGVISGTGSIGGDIIKYFCKFLNFIYSSKYTLISFDLKFKVKFSGLDFVIEGGVSSISPPDGVPLFAQLAK